MDCCDKGQTKQTQGKKSGGCAPSHLFTGVFLLGLAVLAAFYLLAEHQSHLLGALPLLILLACPLMHVFMHHGRRSPSGRRLTITPEPSKELSAKE